MMSLDRCVKMEKMKLSGYARPIAAIHRRLPVNDLSALYIVGILETGIFSGMAKQAYFGAADGSVKIVNAQ